MAKNHYFRLKKYLASLWLSVDSSTSKLYEFGLALTLVGLLFSLFWYFKHGYVNSDSLIATTMFAGLATFVPKSLKEFQKMWFVVSIIIGEIVTRILLSIIFIFIVFPISFVMKLRGHQFLDNTIDKNKKSYWIKINRFEKTKKNLVNQF